MRIVVNGEARELADGTTVGALVDACVASRERVAVERNRAIVARALLDETALCDGDEVEIVTLVGGG